MGDWKLEVFRMSLYVFFPLSIFYVCNQTDYFKKRENISWLYAGYRGGSQLTPEQIEENKRMHEEHREKLHQKQEERRRIREEEELKMLEEKRKAWKASAQT